MAIKLWNLPLALVLVISYCAVRTDAAPMSAPTSTPPTDDDGDAPVSAKDEVWTWCVQDQDDYETCQSMTKLLAIIDPEKEHSHVCVVGNGDVDCMLKVQDGEAKFCVLDGGEIWEANSKFGLIPIRTEVTLLDTKYYAVAVVKKSKCPGSLNDLKGKKSCHTGYGRASGWVLPVTYLVDNKVMPVVTKGPQPNDIESVKAFFSASCAVDFEASTSICTACNQKTSCTLGDIYYDYAGAFRGVVEDACDVAFTKHTIIDQYSVAGVSAQNWTGLQDKSNYQILCPGTKYGGKDFCTDSANYVSCNFGHVPGHAIMVSPNFPAAEVAEFQAVMDAANSDQAFNDLLFTGQNVKGNIFAADATKTLSFNGNVISLLGDLFPKIQELEAINSQTSPPGGAGTMTMSSLLLTISAGLLYFLVQ